MKEHENLNRFTIFMETIFILRYFLLTQQGINSQNPQIYHEQISLINGRPTFLKKMLYKPLNHITVYSGDDN